VSKFDLRKYAQELNDAARSHPIGALQEIRAELHGKQRTGRTIFSGQTITKTWAFHHGGRSELQFNIGFDGTKSRELRSGVAFSFVTSQSFPSIEPLIDKARLFNDFLRMNPNLYSDMRMWYWRNDERNEIPVGPILPELATNGVFVFLGNRRSVKALKHEAVLNDMDRLLPLYEYIESNGRTKPFPNQPKKSFVFQSGRKSHLTKTKATYAQEVLDVNLRHNFLLELFEKQLKKRYGSKNVFTENPSGLGRNSIDLVVRHAGASWYYDIKTSLEPRLCIREAMGQLLEYAFWPGCNEAHRLVVVGESAPGEDLVEYCRRLKKRFSFPISYEQIVVKGD
jgi:hypothetical protein